MNTPLKLGVYRHYKGDTYNLIGLGKHSDTHEDYVVYQGLYDSEEFGPKPLWVKPLEAFLEKVEWEGEVVDRFEYVGEEIEGDS